VCAFEYTVGTWQFQHHVSLERHEYAGTIACLLALIRWLGETKAPTSSRFVFRRANRGVASMLTGFDAVVGSRASYSERAHHVVQLAGTSFAQRVAVEHAGEPTEELNELLGKLLPQPELESLGLQDMTLDRLDSRYRRHGLSRRRVVLTAKRFGRTIGVMVVNLSSEGINFSFLENAAEGPFIDPELDPRAAQLVGDSLLAAARNIYRGAGRDAMIVLGDPTTLRRLLPASEPATAYTVATVQGDPRDVIGYLVDHYATLMAREASLTVR
jgi:hypothetical protein